MNIAIVGATGNVGRKVLEVLELKKFPIDQLYLVASPKSVGKKISFNGKDYEVFNLETFDFTNVEITFFAAGGKISEQYAAKAAEHSTVIDNSSYFRMDPDVPLIVPEVNSHDLKNYKKKNIIANANCSVIPLVVALKPLHDLYNIKRIVASTYQSVSGAGKAPMDELLSQTKDFFENKNLGRFIILVGVLGGLYLFLFLSENLSPNNFKKSINKEFFSLLNKDFDNFFEIKKVNLLGRSKTNINSIEDIVLSSLNNNKNIIGNDFKKMKIFSISLCLRT